jgi:ABC-type antimicrobial peptide transport system permease subunit
MASALTMLFTWLVSIFINRRIRQVDMVESLKSVD